MLIHLSNDLVINSHQICSIRLFQDHAGIYMADGSTFRVDDPQALTNLQQTLETARTDDQVTTETPLTVFQKVLKMFTR